jgi:dTDP-4-amino-4,6-dideoxygalactose transaminase
MQVLESNRISYGPWTRRFEQEFAAAHDSTFAIFVNSGTSALSIAVACLKEVFGWKEGDEILVPALTFVATANVLIEHGLRPVFVDCDAKTYNVDPKKIEARITQRTRGIVVVHLLGLVADMDPIVKIAEKHRLRIIEDSCETMGVTYRGKKTGTFGDIACFSTYVAHLIATGVGGFAMTKNPTYAEILRSLANHGRDNIYISIDDDKDVDGAAFEEIIRRRFRFVRRGYSFRATELEAAIGVAQLHRLPEMIKKRRENARKISAALKPLEKWIQLPWYDPKIQEHAFMMYPVVLREESGIDKDALVQHLESLHIQTRDMLPLINQPVYADMHIREEEYPVARWVNRCGFYIGCHQGMSDNDIATMGSAFTEFFKQHG